MPHLKQIFSRDGTWLGETTAYGRFRKHHTEINDLYWSMVPLAGFGDHIARKAEPGTTPTALFHASGPDARRLAPTLAEWRAQFKDFQNWTRLAALMSATSYFEIFLREALTLAVRSDPLCRFGSPKLLDGVTWLKRGVGAVPQPEIRACLIGDWQKRRKAMKALLGRVPPVIDANLVELDRIRRMRNRVGHSFGRPMDHAHSALSSAEPPSDRLNELRFKAWLGLLNSVAKDFDRELLISHTGEFETMLFYHEWRRNRFARPPGNKSEDSLLSKALTARFGETPGRRFCKSAIAYYHEC